MDPLAVSAYGAEQALPLTGTRTGAGQPWVLCTGTNERKSGCQLFHVISHLSDHSTCITLIINATFLYSTNAHGTHSIRFSLIIREPKNGFKASHVSDCNKPPTSGKSVSTNVCAWALIASTRAPTIAMSDSMMLCFCSRSSTPIRCLPYSSDCRFTCQSEHSVFSIKTITNITWQITSSK